MPFPKTLEEAKAEYQRLLEADDLGGRTEHELLKAWPGVKPITNPPRLIKDGDHFQYPCCKCKKPIDCIWGNAHLPWCSDCAAQRKSKRMATHYSGNLSEEFWDRVNALPQPDKSTLYSCGILLQNMEESVLRWLEQAEKNAEHEQKKLVAVNKVEKLINERAKKT